MSRIILPIGDTMLQNATLDFAAYMAKQMNSNITAIPLKVTHNISPDLPESAAKSTGIGGGGLQLAEATTRDGCSKQQLIDNFQDALGGNRIQLLPEFDNGIDFKELLQETRYADLVIVEGNLSPESSVLETNPTHHVKELLHHAECPVIVAPLSFHLPDEILFAFDGTASSIHAIKSFAQLFPALCKMKLNILEVYPDKEPVREKEKLQRWLSSNFLDAAFIALQGDADDRLLEYSFDKHQSIIVMGGYGRSIWSRFMSPSTAATVVKIVASPVFIAHR